LGYRYTGYRGRARTRGAGKKQSTDPPVHLLNLRPTHPPSDFFFFLTFFLVRFWAFLGKGSSIQKHHNSKTRSDPSPFSYSDPPTHHGGHRGFFCRPLARTRCAVGVWRHQRWQLASNGFELHCPWPKRGCCSTQQLPEVKSKPRGRQKKKSGTPVVGGWVRVRKRTRVRFVFSIFFLSCFLTPLIEKRPKT
jgi:hypothetical protein